MSYVHLRVNYYQPGFETSIVEKQWKSQKKFRKKAKQLIKNVSKFCWNRKNIRESLNKNILKRFSMKRFSMKLFKTAKFKNPLTALHISLILRTTSSGVLIFLYGIESSNDLGLQMCSQDLLEGLNSERTECQIICMLKKRKIIPWLQF